MAKEISYAEGVFENSRGLKLFTCSWLPSRGDVRGLIFLCHGYGMECSVYMKEVGERLSQAGYGVYGADIEGHGKSEGLRGYIPDFNLVVDDCASFFKSVREKKEYRTKKVFLYGESMGGAVALLVHQKEKDVWSGAILVAPMCKISTKLKPPEVVVTILTWLSYVTPTYKMVPIKDIIEVGFKDPLKREQIYSNPYIYREKPRLKTALELLRASNRVEEHLNEVNLPFLLLHGKEDVVTEPNISKELYMVSKSLDKTFKLYPTMWHGLINGEPEENSNLVFNDIKEWLNKHTSLTLA